MRSFILAVTGTMLFSAPLSLARSLRSSSPVLLEMKTYGGMVPPPYIGRESGIQVMKNGEVYAYVKRSAASSAQQTVKTATLERHVVEGLEAQLATLIPGELVFPDSPRCTDAPVTDYRSSTVVFAQHWNCATGYLQDKYVPENLKNLLDGFWFLGGSFLIVPYYSSLAGNLLRSFWLSQPLSAATILGDFSVSPPSTAPPRSRLQAKPTGIEAVEFLRSAAYVSLRSNLTTSHQSAVVKLRASGGNRRLQAPIRGTKSGSDECGCW